MILRKHLSICVALVMIVMLGVSAINVCAEDEQLAYLEMYDYNFDDETYQDGHSIKDSGAYTEFFVYDKAGAGGISKALYATEGDNRYITMQGYNALMSSQDIWDYPYEFSVDVRLGKIQKNQYFGIFARGVMPGMITVKNPDNGNRMQSFPYFESDWYFTAKSDKHESGIGGSGVALIVGTDRVSIVVKILAEEGLYIAEERVDVELPSNYRVGEFNNFKVSEDSAEKVSFYVNDVLLGAVRFSDPGMEYEEVGFQYYEKAEILDPAGKVLKTVTETRINSDGSQIAVASRSVPMDIDNLHVGMGVDPETLTPTPESTQHVSSTSTPISTTVPPTLAPTNTPGASSSQGGVPVGVVIGIVAGVVAIAAVAVILILKKKK